MRIVTVLLPEKVRAAVKELESVSCIIFDEIKEDLPMVSYVSIVAGTGCWSYVGFIGNHIQKMSLGTGCYNVSFFLNNLQNKKFRFICF